MKNVAYIAAEAAQVYATAALKYHGEYAYQNFKEGRQDATKSIVG